VLKHGHFGESGSEFFGNFQNLVLEEEEDQLDRSCEKKYLHSVNIRINIFGMSGAVLLC
jgi:hypothetical protein